MGANITSTIAYSSEKWKWKNQQDHGQHPKKNTNGTTNYPQRSAVYRNRVVGSRSHKAKSRVLMEHRLMNGTSQRMKRLNNKIKEWFKERIGKESNNKSKVQHLLDGITNWEPQKRANYMKKLTRPQASTIFKARSRMHFRNKHQTQTCRVCGNHTDT